MLQEDVLELLQRSEGAYLSGEAMSQALGVSRAAVWKAVEALRRAGYGIGSAPNRGYRLDSAPDVLRPGEIAGALEGYLVGREVVCLPTVDSTSSEVKRRAAAGAPEGLAVLAGEQTRGRGRRGNAFQSLAGKGLYCSVLLRPDLPPAELSQLTAWSAVAVCRALEACCGVQAQIKWTNDILLGGRKLGGILTELEFEGETLRSSHVILGIGLNVSQSPADFGPDLAPIATSLLQELGRPVRRAELAAALLRALDGMYAGFPGERDRWLEAYRRRCATLGRQVCLLEGGERVPAFAEGLDGDFALLCRMEDGSLRRVAAGEVSVRGLMGYV